MLRALVRLTSLRLRVLLSSARDVGLRFAVALVIGISFSCAATIAVTTEAPPQRRSRRGRILKRRPAPGTRHSTALSARRSQSFLDNLIAGLGRCCKNEPMQHHDALEFPDGRIVLLTTLSEGQEATVLQLPAQPTSAAEADAQKRVAHVG